MNATSKIILRPDYIKIDGTKSIYLHLTINRKVTYYSLNLSCLEKHWNSSYSRVSKTTSNSYIINFLLRKHDLKARKILFEYEKNDKTLTFLEFEQHFKNNNYNNKSFYTFAENQTKKYNSKI